MTFYDFALVVLLLASFLCLFRIGRGPSAADRAVAIDILGTLIVGFCCVFLLQRETLVRRPDFYMNVAMAWALLSFIGTIALAKHLEGRRFDE